MYPYIVNYMMYVDNDISHSIRACKHGKRK